MQKSNPAILLINTGTPLSTSIWQLAKYLNQFLSDKFVIDIPYLPRQLLVKGVIVPFRSWKSRRMYKKIWTREGSPFLLHSLNQRDKLKKNCRDNFDIYLGMRYGKPSISDALIEMQKHNHSKWIILPLFPQFASSVTTSALQQVTKQIGKLNNIPDIQIINSFYNKEFYIRSLAHMINSTNHDPSTHVVFSFHGLPVRHVEKTHIGNNCEELLCSKLITEKNKNCYLAQCHETARLTAKLLGLENKNYSVSFQSRMSKNWLRPYTDKVLQELPGKNIKNISLVCPSFVTDNLETLYEIDMDYKHIFKKNGGETLKRVPAFNDHPFWIDNLCKWLVNNIKNN